MHAWIVTTYDGRSTKATIKSLPKRDTYYEYNGDCYESVAQLWNQAIKDYIEFYDVLIITQDDVILEPDTAPKLVKALSRYALVSAWEKDYPKTKKQVGAFCFTITPKLIDKVGYFDEGFEKYLLEDMDYFYRIKLAGLKARSVTPVLHAGGISSRELSETEHEIWVQNYVRYMIKWGGATGQEKYTTPFNGLTEQEALELYDPD